MSRLIDRTGEISILKSGLTATIISYRNANNLDIEFENGVILCNQTYDHFKNGWILCPMIITQHEDWCLVRNDNVNPPAEFMIDLEDVGIVKDKLWCYNQNGYIKNQHGLLHRAIMKAKPHELVDHINHDKLDNRKRNLRIATKAQNSQNSLICINNKSGYKGVSWHKVAKKWAVYITIKGKSTYLGLFTDKKQAAMAYNISASEHFGEFAKLNEI